MSANLVKPVSEMLASSSSHTRISLGDEHTISHEYVRSPRMVALII